MIRHPKLTPLRALQLLRRLEAAGDHPTTYVLNDVREALAQHVAAQLTHRRKRARR